MINPRTVVRLRKFRCKRCGRLLAKVSEKGYQALLEAGNDAYIEIKCSSRGYKPSEYIPSLDNSKCGTTNQYPERQ